MKFLKFSSFIFLLGLTACFPKIPKQSFQATATFPTHLHHISNSDSVLMYRTQIQSIGKSLSGTLVAKPLGDSLKVAFLSDAGINFFNLTLSHSGYQVSYCIEQLNKKVILDVLTKDISLITGFLFGNLLLHEKSEKMERFDLTPDIIYSQAEKGLFTLYLSDKKRNKKAICRFSGNEWKLKHIRVPLKMSAKPIPTLYDDK